jgi:hypothetical protein
LAPALVLPQSRYQLLPVLLLALMVLTHWLYPQPRGKMW